VIRVIRVILVVLVVVGCRVPSCRLVVNRVTGPVHPTQRGATGHKAQ